MWRNEHVTVHPGHDVWALGVIAYEAITQTRSLTTQNQIAQCAQGHAQYPWEAHSSQQPQEWLQSRLRTVMMPCLQRDAAARPTAAQTHARVARLGQRSTAR